MKIVIMCAVASVDTGHMFCGPGYADLDSQVMRNIPISEKYRFGIGVQFNIFNHPNFANPANSVTSSSLGFISGTVAPPTSTYGSFKGGTVSGRAVVMAATPKF
jgi:hypothetical protein